VESLAVVIIISSFTTQARHMPHVRNRCADKKNFIRRRVSYHPRLCMRHCISDQLVVGQRDIIFFENKDRSSSLPALPCSKLMKFVFAGFLQPIFARRFNVIGRDIRHCEAAGKRATLSREMDAVE
jgi:hypothetical protein